MPHPFKTLIPFTSMAVLMAALVACGQDHSAADATSPAATPAAAPAAPNPSAFTATHADYQCAKGKTLEVAYLNLEDGNSFAAMPYDGNTVLMRQVVSASGSVYEPIDTSLLIQWRTQGESGSLYQKAADKPDQLTPILEECQEVS